MMRNTYTNSVGKPGGNRRHRVPEFKWKDNIEMNFTELGCENADWTHEAPNVVQMRTFMNTVMNLRVP